MKAEKLTEVLDSLPQIDFDSPVRKQTDEMLKKFGIPDVQIPDFDLMKYPDDVTALGDEKLGNLLSTYKTWTGYMEYLMALKEADIILLESSISRYVKNEVNNNKRRKADSERDDVVVAMEGVLIHVKCQYKIVEGRQKFFEACSYALSRELTRRTSKTSYNG